MSMLFGDQMDVQSLIKALEAAQGEEDKAVAFDFCGVVPSGLDSYRGFYEDLAIGWESVNTWPGKKLNDFIAELKAKVGQEITGWKGGDYIVRPTTSVWVANRGKTDSTAVVGVKDMGYLAVIETRCYEV